jgi:hypothetical protein
MIERDAALLRAKQLKFSSKSFRAYLQDLILGGYFDNPSQSKDIVKAVRDRFGRKFPVSYVQTYIRPFLTAGVLRGKELPGRRGNLWFGAWLPDSELSVRGAAERLRISTDTTGWPPEVAEDFQLGLGCHSNQLWKAAAVMVRRAYEGALILKYKEIEGKEPEKEGSCPKCSAKMGRRPMSITDLHYWAAGQGQVREKMDGISILLKDLGAGGAHPTKSRVMDPDTTEIILKCGAVLLRDLYRRGKKT